jgi:O-antigen/teichoic acid export membrane protein
LTTGTIAAVGFIFWLLNSHLFSAGQIGVATTLISGTTLIAFVSLFGFDTTFVRFLPASRDRDADINTGLLIVFSTAIIVATLYVVCVPLLVPKLAFIRESFGFAIGFILLTAFWAVNLVTDSVFIAFRKAHYNLVIDGVIQGVVKLTLPALVVALGAYGIFMASGLAAVVAVVASIVLLMRTVGYTPKLSFSPSVLTRTRTYSAANYVANLLNLCPWLLTPLIILNVRGPRQAGFYYIAFQVSGILFSVGYAVSLSLFAESSYEGSDLPSLLRRSATVLALVCVPSGILVAVAGHWLLLLFGHQYSANATPALAILALSTPSVALYSAATTVLRITKQLRAVVAANVVYAVVIVGLTLLGARHGLQWVALAWLLGNTISGLVAIALAQVHLHGQVEPA